MFCKSFPVYRKCFPVYRKCLPVYRKCLPVYRKCLPVYRNKYGENILPALKILLPQAFQRKTNMKYTTLYIPYRSMHTAVHPLYSYSCNGFGWLGGEQ